MTKLKFNYYKGNDYDKDVEKILNEYGAVEYDEDSDGVVYSFTVDVHKDICDYFDITDADAKELIGFRFMPAIEYGYGFRDTVLVDFLTATGVRCADVEMDVMEFIKMFK
jgi:hypothetical protein